MVAATVGDYTGAAPFHTYYMTVSGHLRYTFGGNFIARKNRDLVADLPLGEHARAYLATQIELDRALELLLKELEAAGVTQFNIYLMCGEEERIVAEYAEHVLPHFKK